MGRGPTSLVAPTPARPGKVRRKWARPAADSQPQGVCVCGARWGGGAAVDLGGNGTPDPCLNKAPGPLPTHAPP